MNVVTHGASKRFEKVTDYWPFGKDGTNPVHVRIADRPHSIGLYGTSSSERAEGAASLAEALGLNNQRVYIPLHHGADANVTRNEQFTKISSDGTKIYEGCFTLGMDLAPGETLLFETKSCPIVIMALPGHTRMVVARADADSLIGTFEPRGGREARHPSRALIQTMFEFLGRQGMAAETKVSIILGEGATGSDEVPGGRSSEASTEMLMYVCDAYGQKALDPSGRVSFPKVIAHQCRLLGISAEHVVSEQSGVMTGVVVENAFVLAGDGRKIVSVSFRNN